jgi:hypothetical protein
MAWVNTWGVTMAIYSKHKSVDYGLCERWDTSRKKVYDFPAFRKKNEQASEISKWSIFYFKETIESKIKHDAKFLIFSMCLHGLGLRIQEF